MSAFARLSPKMQAITLMLFTIFCFSVMDAIAKGLAARYHTFEVVWARYLSQTVLAFLFLAPRLTVLLRTRFIGMQVLRSAFLFAATICFFFGIVLVGLAQSAAIMSSNPLIITILAAVILGEVVGARRIAGVVVGFAGALIIIRPGTSVFTPEALLPLAAACFYACYAISTRFLGREESPWTSFLYTATIGAVVASAIVPWFWTTPSLADAGLMLILGAIGGVGHISLIRALTLAEASVIAPFAYSGLIWATLWGMIFFDEFPDMMTYFGALVIAGAGIYVWHRERQVQKRAA